MPATYCHTKRISPKTLNRLFKDRKRRLPVDNSQHASQLPEQSSSDAPAVNGEASLSLQTGRLAPETGDVQRSVDVPMMFGTAIAAHPAPDPKTFQPSRTTDASTRRTGSGCTRFIDFQIDHPRVIVLISEVAPQHRPSGIEHALCHPGPCQLGSRHVSDRDPAALVDQPPGKLVQEVLSSVGDLGVDRLDLPLTPRLRQLRLEVAVKDACSSSAPSEQAATAFRPRSVPISSTPPSGLHSLSQTMLQYQRPRASCEKLPDLIRPSIGRWRRPKDLSGVVVRRSIVLAARHDDQ